MVGLPNELYNRCRFTLLECSEFGSNSSLSAVFVTEELSPFRDNLPEATSKTERVDKCLEYVLRSSLSDNRPVLPLFLEVLRDRYHEGSALRDRLDALVREVFQALQSSPSSPVSPKQTVKTQNSKKLTWLHLSDLHFRESRTYDENIVLKALLKDVDERIKKDSLQLQPDFVVVTGDIAFSCQPSEYDLAQKFFDDLLAKTGLSKNQLFIVPGNHDVNRKLITASAKTIGSSLKDRNSVNTLLVTAADRRLVFSGFEGYAAFVNSYFAGHLNFDDEHYFYVHAFKLDERTIAILGINSAWLVTSDEDKAAGLVIGERQVRSALETAEKTSADLKIALLHHPFDWLREFDRNDSEALLLDNCDFVLHGHLHQSALTQLSNPDSSAMMIAGGACYETREYPNSYNFVQLDLSAGTGTVYLRRYSDQRGGFWAKDTLTYKNVPDGIYRFSFKTEKSHQTESDTNANTGGSIANLQLDLGTLRQRLKQLFDDPEFDAFCLDNFPNIYDRFSRGMRKDEKITVLLDACRRSSENYQKLLAVIEE